MATNTTNYRFKKPDESDFYDVADQNKNWDLADEALKNLDTPTFEDYQQRMQSIRSNRKESWGHSYQISRLHLKGLA